MDKVAFIVLAGGALLGGAAQVVLGRAGVGWCAAAAVIGYAAAALLA